MNNVEEEMRHLHELAKREPKKRFNHLWENLASPLWLMHAWEQIRRNSGSNTPGVDRKTAVDIDAPLITQWAEELKTGKYYPKPVQRTYIEKSNGKKRPLGIPTIKDRVIQQGLKMLLEPIFEADFRNCSHGFRPKRSAHTALRDVANSYPLISWVIEGDIKECFESIPHAGLLETISRRISDGKILNLIKKFLKAGYMEDWKYSRTYSGTPQGGIISPLLANIFLNRLDKFVEWEFEANRTQSSKESSARRNLAYRKIADNLAKVRKKLAKAEPEERRPLVNEVKQLKKQLKHTPQYDKDKKHPCKVKYARYADDFVLMVAGTKKEAEAVRSKVRDYLSARGLELSEEKTKITHWSHWITFLGYQIRGKLKRNGVSLSPILKIPNDRFRKVVKSIETVARYYHIPEADAMIQISALFRGWCNYYRYATSPQPDFNKLSAKTWWYFAHFLARKTKTRSIKQIIIREKKAGRLKVVEKEKGKKGEMVKRKRNTFLQPSGKKTLTLDIFPPKTGHIRSIVNKDWTIDLKPVTPLNWQSGRSLATRLEAEERAKGICEKCGVNPVQNVHHTVPIGNRSFLARVMSDKSQRYTAKALCRECHLEDHQGSFRRKSNRNAGYAERCSPSVGTAEPKPALERG
jgi:group II intron reverse transcriptase/maturase